MKRKITIITISYIIGLIWGLYFSKNITLIFVILLLILILIFRKNIFFTLVIIVTIISSIYNNNIKNKIDKKYENISEITVIGTVYNKFENEYYEEVLLEVETIDNNKMYKNDKLIIYISKSKYDLKYGDKLLLKGNFSKAEESRNYRGYNYKEYLKTQKIYGILEVDSKNIRIINKDNIPFFQNIIKKINEFLKNKFYEFLPKEYAEICIALILGDKENVDDKVIENFSSSNLAHILAVSGMHLTYIILILSIISRPLAKSNQNNILIFSIIFFCNLVGNSDSIVRASIMMILYLISKKIHRKSDSITNLSISVLLILIENPYAIKSLSFLLSVGGTLGIILFYSIINNFFERKLNSKNKFLKYLKSQIALSISANIIIMPIITIIYNNVSIIFFISNPIASFLLNIIMPLTFIYIFISIFFPIFVKFIAVILTVFLEILLKVSDISSNLDFLEFCICTLSVYSIIVYYLNVILIFIRSKVNFFDKKIITKIIKKIILIYLSIVIIINFIRLIEPNMHIFFIDVGQGDSTLIITRFNKTVLIDGGGSEIGEDYVGENILFPYLLDRGIKKIDYIMISHFDSDHCKGILYIMENLKVENVIISKQIEKSDNYNLFLKIIKQKNINIIMVKSGMNVQIDNYTYFEILWPNNQMISENAMNNNSIVARFIYRKFKILFTGDIEFIAEQEIIKKHDIRSNVLKVAHHGSDTSSDDEFIKKVNPEIALIGVGKNNRYGHPSNETLKKFENINTQIYRTDLCGEIYIKVNKNGNYSISKHLK